jgi:hypothetical protein
MRLQQKGEAQPHHGKSMIYSFGATSLCLVHSTVDYWISNCNIMLEVFDLHPTCCLQLNTTHLA